MRVLHLVCIAPPEVGGMGKEAYREVVALRAHGIDARIITRDVTDSTQEQERSFVHRLKTSIRFGNASLLQEWKELIATADVLHLHYPFYGFQEQLLLSGVTLPPVVITFHMDATAPSWKGMLFNIHRWFLQNWILRKAKSVLVSSYDYANHSSVASYFSRKPDAFIELPFALDTELYKPGTGVRERFGITVNDPVLSFVGGLDSAHAFKGLGQLLQAMTRLDSAVQLIVVGDGDLRAGYEEEAIQLGIRHRVHFLGRLEDDLMPSIFRSADVHVLPSVSRAEAFGIVALEAQASGVPVVASDFPGVRTVVRHRETGVLVPPGDVDALAAALAELLSDAMLRQRFGAAARAHAETYNVERFTQKLIEIYSRLCV